MQPRSQPHRGHTPFTGRAYNPGMADRHWSTDALIARTDVALALSAYRLAPTPRQAQYRLDFLNIVSAVDFQSMKSDQALESLTELLGKIRADETDH